MKQELRQDMDKCGECQELKVKGLLGCCQYHLDKQFEGDAE